MPFNWRLLFLTATALLFLKGPLFDVDPDQLPCEGCNALSVPRTVTQPCFQPGGQLLEEQSIIPVGSETDSTDEGTRNSTALISIEKPQKQQDFCPLADICLASGHPSTEINEMEDSVSLEMILKSKLLQAELLVRAYLEKIINMLPKTLQPGPVFYERVNMVMSLVLNLIKTLIFIRRIIKNWTNRLPNQQLGQFQDGLSFFSSHQHDWKLRACVWELKRNIIVLKQREDRIKRAKLFKKKCKNNFEQREVELQQTLAHLEQDWTERFEMAMEESGKCDQCFKELHALQHKRRKIVQLYRM